jgi:uncharacterized membrane protein YecN with MAPEG domain
MTNLNLAAIYAGVNILLLLALALLVVAGRFRSRVMIGDGGDEKLFQAGRVHGNAVENIPAGLVGLALLAMIYPQAPQWMIHVGGGMLTAGRVLHAVGLSSSTGRSMGRALGMLLTWSALAFIAIVLIALGAGVTI